ncbi:MAG: hypothetical protein FWG85_01435 [Bacteroidetes bacterium]|nr:hypothetical protein [Bacteroidota bacterium]
MLNDCCIDYQELLENELKNPNFQKEFEKEKNLYRLEVKFNDLLQKIGCKGYRLELVEDNDYYNNNDY